MSRTSASRVDNILIPSSIDSRRCVYCWGVATVALVDKHGTLWRTCADHFHRVAA